MLKGTKGTHAVLMVWYVRKSAGKVYLTERMASSPATAVAIIDSDPVAPGLCME